MNDVAAAAGVSQATVSVVLNDRRDVAVADATRERVLAASSELGFRLNRAAQDLRLSRSSAIGIVADAIATAPFAGNILAGLQQAAREADWACVIVEPDDDANFDAAAQDLVDRAVRNVVYARPATSQLDTSPLPGTKVAYANCWPAPAHLAASAFLPDEAGGGEQAATALLAAGHRDLLVLAGTPGEWATQQRMLGLQRAASKFGLNPTSIRTVNGNYSISSGYRLAAEWVPRTRPTAVLCGNDRMALGALLALDELGLSVPHDVSLVGYDDQPDFADELHPRLTTVAIPFRELGLQAGRTLTGRQADAQGVQLVACTLVSRDSVASPRS